MGFFKEQLRSVIEWQNPDEGVLFQKWTENGDEIKNASKLIVGPGQGCIFVYQGKVEAVLEQEGITELSTANIPFWTTIQKFMQAFESEHEVGIYFFKRTQILNQKWGTRSVIKYMDPQYKFPVGLQAFGNYSFKINKPRDFFVNVVGTTASYLLETFREVMSLRMIQPMTDYLAESKFSYADIDSSREEIARDLVKKISVEFSNLGFKIEDFRIEGTSFDPDTMNRINKIGDVQADVAAAGAAGLNYEQMQRVAALRDAAKNEGGAAGAGVGIGAGIGLGNMMSGSMSNASAQQSDPSAKLLQLKNMFDQKLINEKEYEKKKKQILDSM